MSVHYVNREETKFLDRKPVEGDWTIIFGNSDSVVNDELFFYTPPNPYSPSMWTSKPFQALEALYDEWGLEVVR